MKRFLLTLAVLMLSITATLAEVLTGSCGTNVTYTLDTSTGVLTIQGTGAMSDYSYKYFNSTYVTTAPWRDYYLTVKSVTISQGVTSIGNDAFYGCSKLTSVTIPNSVTSIGDYAFSSCSSLTSVTIPEGVTSIGDYAFSSCSSLTSITIPESVTSIGYHAFSSCSSLTSITIPEGVTSIGYYAFNGCSSLTSITIPSSVTSIGNGAFCDCFELSSIVVDPRNAKYDSRESCIAIIETSTNTLVQGCKSTTIPSSVTSIGDRAFSGCSSLTSITIPNSVTSIGSSAFAWCSSLTSITIPNSVTSIGSSAFAYCSSLTSITIPGSVTSIGSSAFYNCSSLKIVYNLSSLNILVGSSNYGYVGYYANAVYRSFVEFDGFRFTKGTNGENILSGYVGNSTSLVLPQNFEGESYKIGDYAFYNRKDLTSITIPEGVTSIGNSAFSGCNNMTELIYNAKNATVYSSTGSDRSFPMSLTTVTIGNSVETIPAYFVNGNSNLRSITIPEGVTSIGSDAFYNCPSLKTVYNLSSLGIVAGSSNYGNVGYYANAVYRSFVEFDGFRFTKGTNGENILSEYIGKSTSLVLPQNFEGESYKIGSSAFYNRKDLTSITIPEGVTSIGDYAFSGCSSLTSITIPNSVTSIGNGAFYGCSSLTSITISEGVTSIGEGAFAYCSSLTSITIPSSVTSIGSSAFSSCSSLTSINIPEGVTSIGNSAFSGCSSLTSITIPEGVTSIGNDAFSYCSSLTSITIPNSVTSIGSLAFEGCSSLTSIAIPSSVTSIGWFAFNGCSSLTSIVVDPRNAKYDSRESCNAIIETSTNTLVQGCKSTTIPSSVTSIGDLAFYGRSSLTSITIPESVTSIGDHAFDGCSSLTSITIPGSVTSIGDHAFDGCSSLTSVTIPEGVTSIGWDAFKDCSKLTSINIPEGVTSIGYEAFRGCSSLTSITIPESVTSIGDYAFNRCSTLTDVTCLASIPPSCDYKPFSTYGTLHVLPGCGDAYRAADYWKNFTIVEDATVSSADIAVLSNAIYTSSTEVKSGEQIELPILMKNANEVSGFEFDLELPEGVTVPEDEDGLLIVDQSFERTTTRKTNSFDATKNEDGSIHVECCLKADQSFTGNDGEVCVIKLQVDEFAQSGSYPLLIKNVLIKGLDGSQNTSIARVKSTLSIRSEITLADGAAYSNNKEKIANQLTYTRSFSNGNWQAMYIPFAISTEALAENGLEVARLNNVNQYDYEDDGTVDETAVEIFRLRNGSTKPNTVYMIRAKETGDKVITMEDVTLYPAQENSHSVTSWDTEFTFVGTYHTITGQEMLDGEYFAMGGGMLHQTSSSANDLKPQRWYMTVTDREGNKKNVNEVKVFLYGEEDLETGIVTLYSQPERGEGIYDLSGRKTSGTQKGVYIKDGKVIIRK